MNLDFGMALLMAISFAAGLVFLVCVILEKYNKKTLRPLKMGDDVSNKCRFCENETQHRAMCWSGKPDIFLCQSCVKLAYDSYVWQLSRNNTDNKLQRIQAILDEKSI